MDYVKKRLTKKISTSDLFIVLGTRNYVAALKENGENIATQVNIARELKKPFFMVVDRNLSKEDRQYLGQLPRPKGRGLQLGSIERVD